MLSDAELVAMRSTVEESLPDECVIVTRSLVPDGAGGHTESTSSTTVPCRLSPTAGLQGGAEGDVGDRVTPVPRWTITVAHDVTVGQADRITVGSRTFEVLGVDVDRSWDLCKRILVVEVL